jgi:hypothetical protein
VWGVKKLHLTGRFTLGSCLRGNLRACGFLVAAKAASKQPERYAQYFLNFSKKLVKIRLDIIKKTV